jgi:hypothetical protein
MDMISQVKKSGVERNDITCNGKGNILIPTMTLKTSITGAGVSERWPNSDHNTRITAGR